MKKSAKKGVVFFFLLVSLASRAVAQNSPADVWFAESSLSVPAGEKFVTNIMVNTGDHRLAAFTFELGFNPGNIAVDTAVGNNGVTMGPEGFVLVANPDTAGKIIISAFHVDGADPSPALHLLSIAWIGIGTGTTTIANNITVLADVHTNVIGTPYGYSTQVTVGCCISPPPTITPTSTPTATPTTPPIPTPTATPTRTPTPTPTFVPHKAGEFAGDVWFEESDIHIEYAMPVPKFTTDILVNTGTQKLAAYTFEIAYDSLIIELDTSVGTNGVTAGPDGFVTVVGMDYNGRFIISSFDVAGKGPSTSLHLLSIAWSVVSNGTGTTLITNNVTILIDELTNTIGTPYGFSAGVTIDPTGIITIPPSSTPTSTPTATPTTDYGCTNPTPISGRFVKDGTGEFCWATTSITSYINSWNLRLLEVNGVNFTNKYVDRFNLPPLQNGLYYIRYVSDYNWGHVEIVEAGGTVVTSTPTSTPTYNPTSTPTPTPTLACFDCERIETGTVTDSSGQPVAGASVYELHTSNLKATTDAQGFFTYTTTGTRNITGCPAGDTYLLVQASGYQEATRFIDTTCRSTPRVHAIILLPATSTPTTSIACPSSTLPFIFDGAGERCLVTASNINYLNSWNMDYVKINGKIITNMWIGLPGLPPKANSLYTISWKGSYAWSHLEIR